MTRQPPRRRATDRYKRTRIAQWLDDYGRDLWLFIVTVGIIITLALYGQQQRHTNSLAHDNCERAKIGVPIVVQAARKLGVPQDELRKYQARRPKICKD